MPDQTINITIYKGSGTINLSQYAYIALGRPNFVVLRYSNIEHTLIMTRASQSDSGALKMYLFPETTKHCCHAKQFCVLAGISLERLHRYEAVVKDGSLLVDLNKEEDRRN